MSSCTCTLPQNTLETCGDVPWIQVEDSRTSAVGGVVSWLYLTPPSDDRLQTRLNKRVAETAKDVTWVWYCGVPLCV